ncbi:MAG: hypothetical protein QM817_23965 [Archangium sp.]
MRIALLCSVVFLAACGPRLMAGSDAGGCSNCLANQTCDALTQTCVAVSSSRCGTSCGGAKPFCDESRGACVECTPTQGCSGSTPLCNTNSSFGATCVECLSDADCPGSTCSQSTRSCRSHPDAGSSMDAGSDAGVDAGTSLCPARCTGTTPFCDMTSATCVQCLNDPQCGGGSRTCDLQSHRCVLMPTDGGTCVQHVPPMQCTSSCMEGFTCIGGSCVLNGGAGPVQVTVRWDTETDVDLHLDEPLPDGGVCEIYYGDTGGSSSSCGAQGELDLDSNAGCSIDDVDIENIIYPAGQPAPRGTYVVRVDYYDSCSVTVAIPFEIEVRANGQTNGWCDVFQLSDSDNGGAGSGRVITTFTVP